MDIKLHESGLIIRVGRYTIDIDTDDLIGRILVQEPSKYFLLDVVEGDSIDMVFTCFKIMEDDYNQRRSLSL